MSFLPLRNPFLSLWAYLLHLPQLRVGHTEIRAYPIPNSKAPDQIEDHIESSDEMTSRYQTLTAITTATITASDPQQKTEYHITNAKGRFISGGVSGIVELLPSGNVLKSPHAGSLEDDCREDLANEAKIYLHLGKHARLVPMISFSYEDGLCLEYMPNGNLRDYLCRYNDTVSREQRHKWAYEAAEGLDVLHSADIIHSDPKPSNFLLDACLNLRIADFGCSSFRRSQASAHADLFALGSTIYEIMTGRSPYQELPSSEVQQRYRAHEFPDVTNIPCGECIRQCWLGEAYSAQEIRDVIKAETPDFLQPPAVGVIQPM